MMSLDYSLYFIADAELAGDRDLLAIVRAAVRGGVTLVQLRGKNLPFREFLGLSTKTARILVEAGIPLLINDRLDIALACDAEGVHLGQEDMPLPYARKMLGPDKILGFSVNSLEEARGAEREGTDYVGVGPVYATSTKETDLPVLGPQGIRNIKDKIKIPVIAIGGINAENAAAVVEAGADGIAVISAIMGASNIENAARELKNIIRGPRP